MSDHQVKAVVKLLGCENTLTIKVEDHIEFRALGVQCLMWPGGRWRPES